MDFSQVEAEFEKLKAQFEAGDLTEAELKARLGELMIQDEAGRWWMIGYETGQWYRHDGGAWVQGEPPAVAGPPAARRGLAEAAGQAEEARRLEAERRAQVPPAAVGTLQRLRHSFRGVDRSFTVWMGVGWSTGLWLGSFLIVSAIISQLYRIGVIPAVVSAINGSIGGAIVGLITGLLLRRMEPSFRWKQIVAVAIGWAIGWATGGAVGWDIRSDVNYAFRESLSLFGIFGSPVCGAIALVIGGLTTGIALRWTELRLQWKQILTVAIGCVIGYALYGIIPFILSEVAGESLRSSVEPFAYSVIRILQFINVGIVGAIVGWVVSWQVSVARRSSP